MKIKYVVYRYDTHTSEVKFLPLKIAFIAVSF